MDDNAWLKMGGDFCYEDAVEKQIQFSLGGRMVSLRELYRMCPGKCEPWMAHLFNLQIQAMGIKRGFLRILDGHKVVKTIQAARKPNEGGLFSIGQLGACEGDICYVLTSTQKDWKEQTSITIMHEALHLAFGPHPWPHEK